MSAYERNRILLNSRSGRLLDISHLTTADLDSDSRAVSAADFTGDGMPDLIVRSVGGGPLRVFENNWPKSSWLRVSLRGVKSNSMGIGAKASFRVGELTIWRDLYPHCSYQSQLPAEFHVGLGKAEAVDELTIRWPSGIEQHFEEVPVDRHIVITEGDANWAPFTNASNK